MSHLYYSGLRPLWDSLATYTKGKFEFLSDKDRRFFQHEMERLEKNYESSYLENGKLPANSPLYEITRLNKKIDYCAQNTSIHEMPSNEHLTNLFLLSQQTLSLLEPEYDVLENKNIKPDQFLEELKNIELKKQEIIKTKASSEENQPHSYSIAKQETSYNVVETYQQKPQTYNTYYTPHRFKSKGLKNIGNTCYINSIFQALAHCDVLKLSGTQNHFLNELINLLWFMRDSSFEQSLCDVQYRKCLSELYQSNEDFEKHRQQDPKFLFIYIAKMLADLQESINLFRWKKSLRFQHDFYGYNHELDFPQQLTQIINVSGDSSHVVKADLINSFRQLIRKGESRNSGYCTICNHTVDGNEKVVKIEDACYVVFAFTALNLNCRLDEICYFIVNQSYKLSLQTIIMRQGYSFERGHNFAICAEGEKWIIYDDANTSILDSFSISGVYMLFYKVESL